MLPSLRRIRRGVRIAILLVGVVYDWPLTDLLTKIVNLNGASHVASSLTWAFVEVAIGFIAACLPALRPLAVSVLQKVGLLKRPEDLPEPDNSVPTFGRGGPNIFNGLMTQIDSDPTLNHPNFDMPNGHDEIKKITME